MLDAINPLIEQALEDSAYVRQVIAEIEADSTVRFRDVADTYELLGAFVDYTGHLLECQIDRLGRLVRGVHD